MAFRDTLNRLNGPLPQIGQDRAPLDPVTAAMLELEGIRQSLDDLVDLLSGDTVILENRVLIGTNQPGSNPRDLLTSTDDPWYSVLIENANALPVHVGFAGGDGLPGKSGHVIPAQRAVMLCRPFTVVSLGCDPATVPAVPISVIVTRYKRPQTVTGWALA